MIELGACEITGVFGPMCSGKTFLIEQWLKTQNRYVRFDITGETLDNPAISHVWLSPKELYEKHLAVNPYLFRVAFHPGKGIRLAFEDCVRGLARIDSYKLLAVDEFHHICPVNQTDEYVETLLRYARHARIAIVGASQRIADVHKLFTAGCRQIILFHTDEARDYDAIRDRWGRQAEQAVRDLRPLIHNDVTKQTTQVPQALVIARGSKPRIYDFSTQNFVLRPESPTMGIRPNSEIPEREDEREDYSSEQSGGEDFEPGDSGDSEIQQQ